MAQLIFEHSDEKIDVEDGENLAQFCEEAGVPFACTEGVCGTCVIQVMDGGENLSNPTQEELDFLGDATGTERLACQCRIKQGQVKLRF